MPFITLTLIPPFIWAWNQQCKSIAQFKMCNIHSIASFKIKAMVTRNNSIANAVHPHTSNTVTKVSPFDHAYGQKKEQDGRSPRALALARKVPQLVLHQFPNLTSVYYLLQKFYLPREVFLFEFSFLQEFPFNSLLVSGLAFLVLLVVAKATTLM